MKLLQLCLALALAATLSSCTVYDHGGYSSQGYSRGSGYSPFTDRGYDDRLRYSQLRRSAFYDSHDHHDHHDHYDRRDHRHDHRSSSSSSNKSSSSSNRSSSSSNRSSGSSSSKKSSSSSSSKKSSSGGSSKKSSSSSSGSSRGVKDSPRNTPPRLR